MTRDKAKAIRRQVEAMAQAVPDAQAVDAVVFFPAWVEDGHYAAAYRVRHEGKLYRCLQSHDAQVRWEPGVAVSLWAEVLPGQDDTPIGEWVQPDSTNPYMQGDKVYHNGKTWASDIDNNIWEPGVYGWTEVAE